MKTIVSNLLKKHSLRQTETREAVLEIMFDKNYALSHADIEKEIGGRFDRVTIYRTLNAFLENGVIHKVLDNEGGIKYAVCQHEHRTAAHLENHIHFKCSVCQQTLCLDHYHIPSIKLPESYVVESFNVLAEGICNKCNR